MRIFIISTILMSAMVSSTRCWAESKSASSFFVVLCSKPSDQQIHDWSSQAAQMQIKTLERMTPFASPYLDHVLDVQTQTPVSTRQLRHSLAKLTCVQSIYPDGQFKTYAIIPSKSAVRLSNDPFDTYQWNLHNSGQVTLVEDDDIHPIPIQGKPGVDIGWKEFDQSKIKRDVTVAVIDSGLDLEHPEFAHTRFINKPECNALGLPTVTSKDNDHNGFKGDCSGWNFYDNNNLTYDQSDEGHGTSMAGILDAETNNGVGMVGISNHIRVLPLKVYRTAKSSSDVSSDMYLTRIVKAMKYAEAMKADVINMSLGWPVSADNPVLRATVKELIDHHIIIVAAAGNDGNSSLVYPCAYRGVICVGAVQADGQAWDSSNYGGQVDIMAPGVLVLSTIPINMASVNFTIGYQIDSGTSMAAPHIAGIAALLRAKYPHIDHDEILARLLLSARPIDGWHKSLGGLANLARAFAVKLRPVIRPVFKDLRQLYFRADAAAQTGKFHFDLPIHNYGTAAHHVLVQLKTTNPSVTLTPSRIVLPSLGAESEIVLHVKGRLHDLNQDSQVGIRVTISLPAAKSGAADQSLVEHDLYLTRLPDQDHEFLHFPIVSATMTPQNADQFNVVETYGQFATPSFFHVVKTGSKTTLTVLNQVGHEYQEFGPVELPYSVAFDFMIKADLNYDGQPDFLVGYVAKEKGKDAELKYAYFTQDLKPLFGTDSTFTVQAPITAWLRFPNEVTDPDTSYRTMRLTEADLGGLDGGPLQRIAVPIFMASGIAPKEDQNPDPFENSNPNRPRVYFYEPRIVGGQLVFATRNLTNYKFVDNLRGALHLRFLDYLNLVEPLPQTPNDLANGIYKLLISWTHDNRMQFSILRVTPSQLLKLQFSILPFDSRGLNVDAHNIMPIMNVTNPEEGDFSLSSLYTLNRARVAFASSNDASGESAIFSDNIVSPKDPSHIFPYQYFLGTYKILDQYTSFFVTDHNLLVRVNAPGEPPQQFERSVARTTMVPGHSYSEDIVPVHLSNNANGGEAAAYIDASPINARNVYVVVARNGKLVAPLRNNIAVPDGCITRNPTDWNGASVLTFLCEVSGGKSPHFEFLHQILK